MTEHLRLVIAPSISAVDVSAWNQCAGQHPFVCHEFLSALECTGAVGADRGVIPKYALLYDTFNQLVACAPAMLKWGTLREYGPEQKWLKVGAEQGSFKWPKFQLGVPFFPMKGPRLLIRNGDQKPQLQQVFLQALKNRWCKQTDFSAFNVMQVDQETARWCKKLGGLVSQEWNAIWINDGFATIDQYLSSVSMRKRYEFKKNRRQALQHGLEFRILRGLDLTSEMITDYYEGHRRVCARYGWEPWLNIDTYESIIQSIPGQLSLFGYFDQSHLVAGALVAVDFEDQTAYLLQWSEMEKLEGVALDLICARPIEFGIEQRMQVVDSGLLAKHKMLRGWQPSPAYNVHWFRSDSLKRIALQQLGITEVA